MHASWSSQLEESSWYNRKRGKVSFPPFGKRGGCSFLGALKMGGGEKKFFNIKGGNSKRGRLNLKGGNDIDLVSNTQEAPY